MNKKYIVRLSDAERGECERNGTASIFMFAEPLQNRRCTPKIEAALPED